MKDALDLIRNMGCIYIEVFPVKVFVIDVSSGKRRIQL